MARRFLRASRTRSPTGPRPHPLGRNRLAIGGKEGYKLVKEDDECTTNPGSSLKELFNKYGPCLILIDESVAYARQLHTAADLPAGTFETHFTFAQALSEAVKAAWNTLLVVSIPASESPHQKAERGVTDIEVGGERGREALSRLKNAIGRVEASWRPASPDEGFEIVRPAVVQPLSGDQFVARDVVAASSSCMALSSRSFLPSAAKPTMNAGSSWHIHPPRVFDRLYNAGPRSTSSSALRGGCSDGRRDPFALGT